MAFVPQVYVDRRSNCDYQHLTLPRQETMIKEIKWFCFFEVFLSQKHQESKLKTEMFKILSMVALKKKKKTMVAAYIPRTEHRSAGSETHLISCSAGLVEFRLFIFICVNRQKTPMHHGLIISKQKVARF